MDPLPTTAGDEEQELSVESAGAGVVKLVVGCRELSDRHAVLGTGMDELISSHINSDMGNAVTVGVAKENKITRT